MALPLSGPYGTLRSAGLHVPLNPGQHDFNCALSFGSVEEEEEPTFSNDKGQGGDSFDLSRSLIQRLQQQPSYSERKDDQGIKRLAEVQERLGEEQKAVAKLREEHVRLLTRLRNAENKRDEAIQTPIAEKRKAIDKAEALERKVADLNSQLEYLRNRNMKLVEENEELANTLRSERVAREEEKQEASGLRDNIAQLKAALTQSNMHLTEIGLSPSVPEQFSSLLRPRSLHCGSVVSGRNGDGEYQSGLQNLDGMFRDLQTSVEKACARITETGRGESCEIGSHKTPHSLDLDSFPKLDTFDSPEPISMEGSIRQLEAQTQKNKKVWEDVALSLTEPLDFPLIESTPDMSRGHEFEFPRQQSPPELASAYLLRKAR